MLAHTKIGEITFRTSEVAMEILQYQVYWYVDQKNLGLENTYGLGTHVHAHTVRPLIIPN